MAKRHVRRRGLASLTCLPSARGQGTTPYVRAYVLRASLVRTYSTNQPRLSACRLRNTETQTKFYNSNLCNTNSSSSNWAMEQWPVGIKQWARPPTIMLLRGCCCHCCGLNANGYTGAHGPWWRFIGVGFASVSREWLMPHVMPCENLIPRINCVQSFTSRAAHDKSRYIYAATRQTTDRMRKLH